MPSKERIPCAILGATGTVGQVFVNMLYEHPFMCIQAIASSERSMNMKYKEGLQIWMPQTPCPTEIEEMHLRSIYDDFEDCKVVFSALPTHVAEKVEIGLANKGLKVFSNASPHRMHPNVPVLLPMVNAEHIHLIKTQSSYKTKGGFVVCNSNCSTVGLVTTLKWIIQNVSDITSVTCSTLQAVSGAGYPGLSSLDMFNNVVPHIEGEAEKIERETRKILGAIVEGRINEHPVVISASCHRVPVIDGHVVTFSASLQGEEDHLELFKNKLQLQKDVQLAGTDQLADCVRECPTLKGVAALKFMDEINRPQPRLDSKIGGGFTTSVGPIRKCNTHNVKATTLAHNTIIGAAGGSIINAELAYLTGYIR